MENCLMGNPAVSATCKADFARVIAGVRKRAQARVAVLKICDADVRRLCAGVKAGDAQILNCMLTSRRGVSDKCNQAITDAGYR